MHGTGSTVQDTQSRKNQRRSKKRKHLKDANDHSVPPGVAERSISDQPLQDVNIRYVDLDVSSCGYGGKKEGKDAREQAAAEDCSVEALLASGCTEVEWDGMGVLPLVLCVHY